MISSFDELGVLVRWQTGATDFVSCRNARSRNKGLSNAGRGRRDKAQKRKRCDNSALRDERRLSKFIKSPVNVLLDADNPVAQ